MTSHEAALFTVRR